eukprot:jgi/Chlat1/2041/Chrsp164S00134
MRSLRALAQAQSTRLALVAMATPEDVRANGEHLRLADQFVEVPGGPNVNNYANPTLIVESALRAGCDAVWPGWGHASENPLLPELCAKNGLVFLGPNADAMAALGDKIAALLLAQSAGLPTLPWSGSGLLLPTPTRDNNTERSGDLIPAATYARAEVASLDGAAAACRQIGYPAMLKASAGGGGRGIRRVGSDEEARAAFAQVQGEVPGSPILAMKLASQSRHLEVQVLADAYGNVVALHGRDCSIIEEGPITAAPPLVVRALERCACKLARSVGYIGACTVEYLYQEHDQAFFFLELNPRLQVEHPVTEQLTGVNLPAAQLLVAMGTPLHEIADIRRFYGLTPDVSVGETDVINFASAQPLPPKGHAIAVRITSEDPDDGFRPTTGMIHELSFRSTSNAWGYFSVGAKGRIHEFSDSQFGHVFAAGESRGTAIDAMLLALKDLTIRGEIRTNAAYAVDLLQTAEFQSNRIHTGWLDTRIARRLTTEKPPWHLAVICGAVRAGVSLAAARTSEFLLYLQKGQIPPREISLVSFKVDMCLDGVRYSTVVLRGGVGSWRVILNDSSVDCEARVLPDGGLLVQVNGASHVVYAEDEAAGTRLLINGRTCLLCNAELDPSVLRAETPGKLLRYLCANEERIEADQPYAEVEVMKMCMPLLAPAPGIVHLRMPEGATMQAGDVIAELTLDGDGDTDAFAQQFVPFQGSLPPLASPTIEPDKPQQRCAAALQRATCLLQGYEQPVEELAQLLAANLQDPQLPHGEWHELVTVLAVKLPPTLVTQLAGITQSAQGEQPFPAMQLRSTLQAWILETTDSLEQQAREKQIAPLSQLVNLYADGLQKRIQSALSALLEEYLKVEELFGEQHHSEADDVIDGLRQDNKEHLSKVLELAVSHQALQRKNDLITSLFTSSMVRSQPTAYKAILRRFASLTHPDHRMVAAQARQLLLQARLLELQAHATEVLGNAVPASASRDDDVVSNGSLSSSPRIASPHIVNLDAHLGEEYAAEPLEDVLEGLLASSSLDLQQCAMHVYIHRLYQGVIEEDSLRKENKFQHGGWSIATWRCRQLEELPTLGNAPTRAPVINGDHAMYSHHNSTRCVFLLLPSWSSVKEALASAQSTCSIHGAFSAVHVAVTSPDSALLEAMTSGDAQCGEVLCDRLDYALKGMEGSLVLDGDAAAHVCVMLHRSDGLPPLRYTYCITRSSADIATLRIAELPLARHMEPPTAQLLEIEALASMGKSFSVTQTGSWHLYATQPSLKAQRSSPEIDVFARAAIGYAPLHATISTMGTLSLHWPKAADGLLTAAMTSLLDHLEASSAGLSSGDALIVAQHSANHVHGYMALAAPLVLQLNNADGVHCGGHKVEATAASCLRAIASSVVGRLGGRMQRCGVVELELRVKVHAAVVGEDHSLKSSWRVVASSPTEYSTNIEVYREAQNDDASTQGPVYWSLANGGRLHGQPLAHVRTALGKLEVKRLAAQRHGTTYCYDLPALFRHALQLRKKAPHNEDNDSVRAQYEEVTLPLFNDDELYEAPLASVHELVSDGDGNVTEVDRALGQNDCGMVAWRMAMSTLELPNDRREIILVANDVTHGAGAFGLKEDQVFRAVCLHACARGLPLIYIAANSGARIGLADEVRSRFQVRWVDEDNPSKGFHYVYLTPEDYNVLKGHVRVSATAPADTHNGEVHYVLTDIIGQQDGLGVENLSGSGSIAAAYDKAYSETFTLTYVSGRTVGIGAYLARLGRRCIQRLDQPIILTGFSALNKLLGRQVYTSHMQLGGPKVMAGNGVVHLTVTDDLHGVLAILEWLAFIPKVTGGPLPIITNNNVLADPEDRQVTCEPELDPRVAITGHENENGEWLGGLFDRGSFVEVQPGWARTVVAGRARMGGIPMGVIAVETRSITTRIPADPGMPDSQERVVVQAGQVWYPDSAEKTAQALEDMDKEGLPLLVIANWRGFSGGLRDLFEGVLQAGSRIVERLRVYRWPVFVYIPPGGELRGGAWVVMDTQINPAMVEMYADPQARGGVLEPQGVVEIKYRRKELLQTVHRLDPVLSSLSSSDKYSDKAVEREQLLLPAYRQVAVHFAELHDTPYRMAAKGVLRGVVPWREARRFFIKRLRVRLGLQSLTRTFGGGISEPTLREWFAADTGSEQSWDSDDDVSGWLTASAVRNAERIAQAQIQSHTDQLAMLATQCAQLAAGDDASRSVLKRALASALAYIDNSQR